MDIDFYNIYLKKKNEKNLISYLKNIFVYPVYCCSHYTNIVSNSLLLLDGKIKSLKKTCSHEILLRLS